MKMTGLVLALSQGECQVACGTLAHLALPARECQGGSSVQRGGRGFQGREGPAENARMSETRTSIVVAGAVAVAGSLWAPWYAIDFGPEAKQAIGQQAGKLPGVIGDFARQMLTLIPEHIEATAWQAFEKADIILFACAIVAVMAALIKRMYVAGFAVVAAIATVVLQMIDRPGPAELMSLQWGAWLALAGGVAIAG